MQTVMEQTTIAGFQHHSLQELSGGEQQRVFLAQALAQEPDILLLDEPTNHLDLAYQKDLLDLLKRSVHKQELTVVSIFHDVNLASLYCDRLLLMHDGRTRALDMPDGVLTESVINDVYQTEVSKHPHPAIAKPQMHLIPAEAGEWPGEGEVIIDSSMLNVTPEHITLTSPLPLRTLSSGVCGAGLGWNSFFVNRHVTTDYNCSDHKQEMGDYLVQHGFDLSRTVGMMTAVPLEDAAYRFQEKETFSLLTVVTAGVKNATDSARPSEQLLPTTNGTINIWLFVNGKLTEEALFRR